MRGIIFSRVLLAFNIGQMAEGFVFVGRLTDIAHINMLTVCNPSRHTVYSIFLVPGG